MSETNREPDPHRTMTFATPSEQSCLFSIFKQFGGDVFSNSERVRRGAEMLRSCCIAAVLLLSTASGFAQSIITTVAGTNWVFPATPVPALNAPLGTLYGIATDANGNSYVSDRDNNIVVRVGGDGTLTVFAGNGARGFSGDGGSATSAALHSPAGIAVDSAGTVYIADVQNHRVRRVSSGMISTVAGTGIAGFSGDGGPAQDAELSYPSAVALDSGGNLYIADSYNNRIRKISGGIITTVAGNGSVGFSGDGGPATSATLNEPGGVAVDAAGNLYLADTFNNRIRKVFGGIITTIAGNGTAAFSGDGGLAISGTLNQPFDVTVDLAGNLYIADYANSRIRKVSGGVITTLAGTGVFSFSGDGGPAANATFYYPYAVWADRTGNLYIADSGNGRIRKVSAGIITTTAGNGMAGSSGDGGPATAATLNAPWDVAADSSGNLYIADPFTSRIRKVSHGIITTAAGVGTGGFSGDGGPGAEASLNYPYGVAVDQEGNLYIADTTNNRVRKVSNGIITTVAGNGSYGFTGDGGPATSASLSAPAFVAVDSAGNLYISDNGSNRIRKVSNGVITTVAGNGIAGFSGDGGSATSAELNFPDGVAVDLTGNLYIADYYNERIRKVSDGIITTVAGNGKGGYTGDGGPATSAALFGPSGIAVDAGGNLYIADQENGVIRRVSSSIITTVAGNGSYGFTGDGSLSTGAALFGPTGVALDTGGNLYIADNGNDRVREVLAVQPSFTVFPTILSFSAGAEGAPPAVQTVNVSSSLAGLSFVATASDSWLSVTPGGGAAPTTLQVTVDPSQLTANTYTGSLIITAAGGAAQTVSVTFNVSAAAQGKLGVSAPSISFSVTQGSAAISSQVSVLNQGGGSIAYTAGAFTSTGGNWLQVTPASGNVTPTSSASLTVTATPGTLTAGTYSGTIVVSSATTGQSVTVTATLALSAAQQTIVLSQTGLTFTAVVQGGSPLPQSFGILNTGQGSMNWSASTSTLSGGSWLSIDQTSGIVATPYTDVSLVKVSINSAGLPAGNYYGQVQVAVEGAANSPQSVSVALNVLSAGSSPGAEVQPTGLVFIGEPGNSPGSQNVMISNPEASAITFGAAFLTVPTGENWAQVLPVNATVQPNAPVSMLVQPDYSNLTSGVYQGFVSLGFLDGSSRSVHVLAVVLPGGQQNASGAAQLSLASQASGSCSPIQIQPTSLTNPGSSVTIGVAASLQLRAVDACGNLVTSSNGAVAATFNDGDASVNLVHEGNGNWSGTWTPRNGASIQVQITYKAFEGSGTTLLSGAKSITVGVQPANGTPLTLGAANAASGLGAYLAPGGLVSIYGQGLAAQAVTSGSLPFPTNVNGTQVLLGGTALPLRYVGPSQINAQVPFGPGINAQQQLVVQNGTALSIPQSLIVAAAQPAIYTQDESGTGPGVILDYNTGKEVTVSNPASIGDTLTIYCNGLGAVSPPVPTGTAAPSVEPLARTLNPVTVTIGGVSAEVQFAGLAPGYSDLYQVNAVVPEGIMLGNLATVTLTVAGQTSPPVTLAVQ